MPDDSSVGASMRASVANLAGRKVLLIASVLGFLAVAFGAIGSHALSSILSESGLRQYDIAVRYHFLHCLALLAIGLLLNQAGQNRSIKFAANIMLLGVLLFSGSLYALAITGIKWFAFITPLGGLVLLLSWAVLIYSLMKKQDK